MEDDDDQASMLGQCQKELPPIPQLCSPRPPSCSYLSIINYKLQPFDLILFLGSDPVAKFIKQIQLLKVVPGLNRPFHNLWTHSGILIDKTVLPLPFMEDGKFYVYESVFSGRVAGYVYSRVLPVDHIVKKHSYHLGPQVRVFEDVVAEGESDVAVCPLNEESRAKVGDILKQDPDYFLKLYQKYKDFGYPLTILPQYMAASENLFDNLNNRLAKYFPNNSQSKKRTIFCSELVAEVYRSFGLETFEKLKPSEFTPLEIEVAKEFEGKAYYAKENNVMLLSHGEIPKQSRATHFQGIVNTHLYHPNWESISACGDIPAGTESVGDHQGRPIYIARVKIGDSIHIGSVIGPNTNNKYDLHSASSSSISSISNRDHHHHHPSTQSVLHTDSHHQGVLSGSVSPCTIPSTVSSIKTTFPRVPYGGRCLEIRYGFDVLSSLDGFRWVRPVPPQIIPEKALKAGVEEDGERFLYIARARLVKKGYWKNSWTASKETAVNDGDMGVSVGEAEGGSAGVCVVGKAAEHLDGANFGVEGHEVHISFGFDILCFE